MSEVHPEGERGRGGARVVADGSGAVNVATGLPVLDHLLALLAAYARFDLALEVVPASAEAEVAGAGSALGEALHAALRADGARGFGSASGTASEALAHVVIETADEPLLVSNVDLTDARVGGLATDFAGRFLQAFVDDAGLTLHVRLLHGSDSQHVLEAIFKALGIALADATRTH
jgi:imidazoleglycerol-phosphate dehydratase